MTVRFRVPKHPRAQLIHFCLKDEFRFIGIGIIGRKSSRHTVGERLFEPIEVERIFTKIVFSSPENTEAFPKVIGSHLWDILVKIAVLDFDDHTVSKEWIFVSELDQRICTPYLNVEFAAIYLYLFFWATSLDLLLHEALPESGHGERLQFSVDFTLSDDIIDTWTIRSFSTLQILDMHKMACSLISTSRTHSPATRWTEHRFTVIDLLRDYVVSIHFLPLGKKRHFVVTLTLQEHSVSPS